MPTQYYDFNSGNSEFDSVSLETYQASANSTATIETADDGQVTFTLEMSTIDTDAIEAAILIFTDYISNLG